jgi:hypothetical protein
MHTTNVRHGKQPPKAMLRTIPKEKKKKHKNEIMIAKDLINKNV